MGCVNGKTIPLDQIPGYDTDERLKPQQSGTRDSNSQALKAIFYSRGCNHLVDCTTKEKVKVDRLKGAPFAVLFSANGVPGTRAFLRDHLLPAYVALRQAGRPFEVVYVGNDASAEAWRCGMQGMTWLAVPFSLSSSRVGDTMGVFFGVRELPTLVLVDRSGAVVTTEGVSLVKRLGAAAWPFSPAHIQAAGWRPEAEEAEDSHTSG